jgi:hypothetical protein
VAPRAGLDAVVKRKIPTCLIFFVHGTDPDNQLHLALRFWKCVKRDLRFSRRWSFKSSFSGL